MNLRAFADQIRRVREEMPATRALALRRMAKRVRDRAKGLIGTEHDGWAALADATVEEKQRLGFTGKVSATDPLLRTGEYRASIQVGEVTPERSIVGTDDPIAPFQEHGTATIPPRPAIGAAVFQEEHGGLREMGEVLTARLRNRLVPPPAHRDQVAE